jgi:hypothetical protein
MAYRDQISLKDILLSFENVLKIEYSERNIEKIKQNAVMALENIYRIQINGDINAVQNNPLERSQLDVFNNQLISCLKSLSFLTSITLFDKRIGATLKDVGYLGFSEQQLRAALQYLQDETLFEKRGSFLPQLIRNASNLEVREMKRLLTIMFVLEGLGIKEGVAVLAQHLYVGCRL